MSEVSLPKYKEATLKIVDLISNQRTREIIKHRFGLEDGQRQTLEAIGKKYNITRERVRQVEEVAFSVLKKNKLADIPKSILRPIDIFFNKEGQAVREERLLFCLTNFKEPHPTKGAVFFILNIVPYYQRFFDLRQFHPFWTNSKSAKNRAQRLIDILVKKMEQDKQVVLSSHILPICQKKAPDLSERALLSYLDISKKIDQNSFGQIGLSHWPEIRPRGVKDRAYLVLKKENQPLHFRKVADLIDKNNLGSRPAHPQTVHNELIKDSRFVLVGRGTYALTEWGYQPGTVQETIISLLKKDGSLTKSEIVNKVLASRMVKENTVLINLQNKKRFTRGEDGRYLLAKQF